jgi:hypothetical protein
MRKRLFLTEQPFPFKHLSIMKKFSLFYCFLLCDMFELLL